MLSSVELALLIILGTSLLPFILWIYKRRQSQKIFKIHGIPGPTPKFFTGNMLQLQSAPIPNDVISKWLKEYGDVFGYFIGEVPHLVIKDLTILKQVMIKDFHNFSSRTPMFISVKPLTESLLALENPRWKEVRSVLTPTFSANKIKLMFKIIREKISTTEEVVSHKALHEEPFDIYQIMQGLTLDVIGSCALAMKMNCQKDPNDPFLLAVRNFFLAAHNKAVEFAIMFPILRSLFAVIAKYMTAGRMTDTIVRNLKNVIQHRRSDLTNRGTDLLQLLLDSSTLAVSNSSAVGTKTKNKTLLTDDEIIANAYISILAGYETTGTALAFTFYLLVQHPDVQERLYQELLDNCPNDEELTYDVVNSLQYLDQVLSESMRIYPPVTGFITRRCMQDYQIGKYTIPKGVVVQAPIWDIHHDPELWPHPWKFDPERFTPENKIKIDNMSYIPFGIGPRNCIGMRFALLEAKLALAVLIKKFLFVPCVLTENPLILSCPTVIVTPKNGVFLQAKLR